MTLLVGQHSTGMGFLRKASTTEGGRSSACPILSGEKRRTASASSAARNSEA
eukprot:CAMPEP_0197452154 /NCGR_PEP_ID=MMETSP1175-20131217/31286_1 /TAXON_ID=1003142 /ORGANISM="Triceratium dubium, Strain CCMP147" /LENGTH=51 /DNA_ID=CAMNT_0042985089 /DNA_START=92 /DNA_END=244 /DNA_ORIENTATION=-